MRPAPWRIKETICSGFSFAPIPVSAGICGGAPARSSPWQVAQFDKYARRAVLSRLFSASPPVHATSFALT